MKTKKQLIDFEHKGNEKHSFKLRPTLLSLCMLTFIGGYSQTGQVNLNLKNATVKELFREIEKQTSYRFSYRDIEINNKGGITISGQGKELKEVLTNELAKQQLSYTVSGNKIIVSPAKKEATSTKDKKVTGKVVDAKGEPVIGATIMEKGTTNGTITDFDGNFTLNVSDNSMLEVSYVGYQTQSVKAISGKNLAVTLKEDTELLDEVVVVGYGTQKKINLSGSVSAIEGEQIAAKPASDALSALQGELPGVTILRSGGQPGSETSGLRIRGFSSVNDASALVLIDGVEGDMTLINPNDIESISVLKDAASCAIYGARAAAGVVLVTTKSGTEGKPKINYNGYYAINTPGNMPERLTAWEEQDFINQRELSQNGKQEWNNEKSSWVGNPNFNYRPLSNGRWDFFGATNWINEGVKDYMSQQNHSISVSGGSKSINYILTGNFYTKNGMLKYGSNSNDRYNLMAKINTNINKYISIGINTQYQSREIKSPSYGAGNIMNILYSSRGRQPILNPEEDVNESPYNGDLQKNAIDIMKNGGTKNAKYESFVGKINFNIKDLIKGLTININASRKAGYYMESSENRKLIWYDRNGENIRNQVNNPNSLYKGKSSNYHDLIETTINYKRDFIKEQNINILLGTSYEKYSEDKIDATAKNLNSNDFFSFNYYDTSIATNTILGDKIQPWAMMSYFGRINYNFADRYLFEANIRYDGSSRLSPSKRWRAFPSVSTAWRMNQEKWFKINWIDNLKLRASWGQLGNGAVLGLYDYLPLITKGENAKENYIGENAFYQKQLASKDKTWEVISTTNIGIDLGFLNNRLATTFEYYWKYNNDMLAALQLPHTIGIDVPNVNVGKLKTWGWDFEISWRDKIRDFNYQVSFNLSDSNNKLLEYNGASTIKAGSVELLEGYSLNTIWGYKTDGYWSSREEYLQYKKDHPGYQSFNDGKISGGDIKYIAQGKADHTIGVGGATPENPGDLVYLGNSNGRYAYGINISAQWKGFDFSIMFQGIGKREILLDPEAFAPFYQSYQMPWTIHRDFWTENNQDAYWPRLYNYKGEAFNFYSSDKWIQDASYIRLKNVTIGYTLPVFKKYIEKLRIYATGADLWEHSNLLEVFDPEIENGMTRDFYPFFRTITFGLNLTF